MNAAYKIVNSITGNFLLDRDDPISLKLGEIHVLVADMLEGKRSTLVWTDENGDPHVSAFHQDSMPRATDTPDVPLSSKLELTFVGSYED